MMDQLTGGAAEGSDCDNSPAIEPVNPVEPIDPELVDPEDCSG